MPRNGFESVTLKTETVELADEIAKKLKLNVSRPAVIARALQLLADDVGVPA